MEPFYYECDTDDAGFSVMAAEGGCEHGAYYDIVVVSGLDQPEAKYVVDLLNQLWKTRKNKYE